MRDCAVYYTEDMTAAFTEEELDQLQSMLARIAERATGYADDIEFD